tara:strand:- start:889 stop:1584 length:696 start_codon:yes stop_codon:yes gene_type:complete
MKLSIIIPCYNEKQTIEKIVNKILKVNIKMEIIIVDDCSNDGTANIIKKINKPNIKKIFHKKNLGKGAAIKTANKHISGDIILIQDADLEYFPSDYIRLLNPIISKKSKVVYGSRVLGRRQNNNSKFTSNIRILGNFLLTKLSNFINNQNLTDAHTCYKVFDKKIFKKITLKELDFRFCPEVTCKINNLNEKIIEVPIKYNGRSIEHGKKIRLKDAFLAVICLIKYGILFK